MVEKKREAGWFIRCEAGQARRLYEMRTAYPLPREERNAAKVLARQDLKMVVDPRNLVLVWLTEEGEMLETHELSPSSASLNEMDQRFDRLVEAETAAVLLKKWYGVSHSDDPVDELAQRNKDSRDE